MKNTDRIKGYILVILSAVLFGCMPLITSFLYAENINRETVVLLRNFMALPVLAVLARYQNRTFRIPVKALPAIAAIALMGCCVTPLLLYGSYQHIATGTATVFHFVYPAAVVLIELIFCRKKVNAGALFSVLLCVGGICLFYNPAEQLDLAGCALALTSGVTYAIYIVMFSVFQYKEVSGFKLSFYIAAFCTVTMLAVCLITNRLTLPTTLNGWLLCGLLALLISVAAVVMFQKGTLLIGGERAAVLSTMEPLTGVVMGIVIFHEKVTPGMGIGSVVVIAACILITVFDSRHKNK